MWSSPSGINCCYEQQDHHQHPLYLALPHFHRAAMYIIDEEIADRPVALCWGHDCHGHNTCGQVVASTTSGTGLGEDDC